MQCLKRSPAQPGPALLLRRATGGALHLGLSALVACLVGTAGLAQAQEGGSPPDALGSGSATGIVYEDVAFLPDGQDSLSREMPVAPGAFHIAGVSQRAAGPHYKGGAIRTFLFGGDYSDVWAMPLNVPVLDLEHTAGGLTPVERGGGLQTTSLHLKGADGHDYVLRSVDKDAARSLPKGFERTIVADVARSQTVAMNPYGAFVIPSLAQAAGILHTAPLLVVIPDDPRLGEFRDYAGMLALFERKPDDSEEDAARFGYAPNVVGSEKMFEKIEKDYKSYVDQEAFARARLFDMLVGDWDRHDEQWRWAEFEEGEDGKYERFVAVPRDRDFAFAKFDGFLLRTGRAMNSILFRRLTDFGPEINDLLGLNWQGSKMDIRLTSRLTREDWIEIAHDLRASLTDETIDAAVRRWPAPVYAEIGAFTASALKARRDQLPRVAERYYEMLARVVDVVGTNETERFEVTRLSDDALEVVVYETGGDAEHEIYRRTFSSDETKEVRLYGLAGNDHFVVAGDHAPNIRVRAIGGPGEDAFVDDSKARKASRKTHFYDTRDSTAWEVQRATRVHRSNDPAINHYEMRRFDFDVARPVIALEYDSDNGAFFGGSLRFTRHGFRKDPYAATHVLAANYAPRSRAYNVYYESRFVDLWRGWGAGIEAEVLAADNYRNFYGLGNETTEDARDRYQAQMQWITASPMLHRPIGRHATFSIGPSFTYTNIEPPNGLAEDAPGLGFTPEQFTDRYVAGLRSVFEIDSRDSTMYPISGLRWISEAGAYAAVRGSDERHLRLAGELSLYRGIDVFFRPTLAVRVGGAHNFGDFTFYQANTLGSSENLRGYRTTRFSGRSNAYANTELRLALLPFNVYLVRGTLGLLGFYDIGRVWADGERSGTWHQGYGGGLWMSPFDRFLIQGTLGFSPEGQVFDLGFGFQF